MRISVSVVAAPSELNVSSCGYVAMETPKYSRLRVPLSEVNNGEGWISFPHRSLGLDRHT